MNLGIIIIIGYVFMYSCSQSKDPIGVVQMKNDAHGVWEAVEGDISVVDEIGLIVYNFYAIDTKTNQDTSYVTWDNGLNYTKSSAILNEDQIEFKVGNIEAEFRLISKRKASITFRTLENIYYKKLSKIRNASGLIGEHNE